VPGGPRTKSVGWLLQQLPVTAACVLRAGHVVAGVGDVSRPVGIHSVRKSIASALVGQACDRGDVALDMTLADLDIDDAPPLTDPEKSATVADLLTARSGIYLPVQGGEFVGRPARKSHPPGTFWYYNNWDFNVVGHVFERLTGRSIYVAFDHDLASPLGMADWNIYEHGAYHYRADILGATVRYPNYSFQLSARDLALLGQLYLQHGRWAGREVLSRKWVEQSTQGHCRTDRTPGLLGMYGYCWWVAGPDADLEYAPALAGAYSAVGFGGSFLTVLPKLDAVFAVVVDTESPPACELANSLTEESYAAFIVELSASLT
jgi:CubicO group peptidase (beta-lactamase class C family)